MSDEPENGLKTKGAINPQVSGDRRMKRLLRQIRHQITKYFLSVSGRLFFYTLIPPLILTFLLCLFFSAYVIDYHHRIFQKTVLSDFYQIQSSLQYALYTGDHGIIDKAFENVAKGDLKRMDILDQQGQLLYSSEKTLENAKRGQQLQEENKFTLFSKEASYSVKMDQHSLPDFIEVDDFLVDSFTGFGTAVFYYHLDNFWVDHRNILSLGVFLLFQSIFLSFLLSRYVDLRLTKPIVELMKAMRSLKKNNFSLDLTETSFGEMNRLQRSAMTMASSLQQAHLELQGKIDQATRSLREYVDKVQDQKKALEIAHKKAEAISESKSQVLAHISHEYKTPLNSVIGFIDLLLQGSLNAQQKSYCQTMKSSAQHLLMMINDILDFNLIEAGKLSISQKPMSLRECLEDVMSTLTPLATEKGLFFDYLYYEDAPILIRSDPHRLRQVFINLIANAIKFTEAGAVIIRVSLSERLSDSPNKQYFDISIEDTGPGIDPQIEKNLFIPFCHLYASHHVGGTGLGLAITRKILSLLQAEVSYKTQIGKGTTFTIHGHTPPLESKKSLFSRERTCFEKIALVDNSPWPPAMRHHLRYLGFEVVSFTSIEQFEKSTQDFDKHLFYVGNFQDREKILRAIARSFVPYESLFVYSYSQNLLACFDDTIKTLLLPMRVALIEKALRGLGSQCTLERATLEDKKRKKVLLVDDNPINTKILSSYLEKYPLETTILNQSVFFLETVEKENFDLIFLDIFMPKIDGMKCLELMEQHLLDRYKNVPIIAVTANSLANENGLLLKKGFSAVLYKPLCPELLERMIKRYLLGGASPCLPHQGGENAVLTVQEHWPEVMKELSQGIHTALSVYYQEDFSAMKEKVHCLLGIVSYYDSLKDSYELLSQLEGILSHAKIDKKRVLRLLKRLARIFCFHYQSPYCVEEAI